jgi:citrate synthase
MVDDRDEVGVERVARACARRFTGQHRQQVFGMRSLRVRRNQREALAGAKDCGKKNCRGREQTKCGFETLAIVEPGDERAYSVHGRHSCNVRVHSADHLSHIRAGLTKCAGEVRDGRQVREKSLEEEVRRAFKGVAAREFSQGEAANDQDPSGAIHGRQNGLCRNYVVQTCAHRCSPELVLAGEIGDAHLSVNLDQYNQYGAFMAWMSIEEATRRLGVRPQTLYAYVSRGRLEARPDPIDPRRSLYSVEDIETLAGKRAGPRRASEVARDAIAWGEPVLASALTTVAQGRLWYRGRDAIGLSQQATLEEAAAFFWNVAPGAPVRRKQVAEGGVKARLFTALVGGAADGPPTRGRAHAVLATDCWNVLETLVNAVVAPDHQGLIHDRLAAAWGLDAHGRDLVRRALILLMDHELNASTFAARVAASTGASLSACALAGLSALSGPLHGGAVYPVMDFVEESVRDGAAIAVQRRLDEGRAIPGFAHPLYPDGDPRARDLLAALNGAPPVDALVAAVADATGAKPNVDMAIAGLACAYGLSRDRAFTIFAIGRAVGWLGHAMEQIETGTLIRPRARYTGPQIEPVS